MTSYVQCLTSEVRKALARAELKRRGLRVEDPEDGRGMHEALKAGLVTLDAGTDFYPAVIAMANRATDGTLTAADRALLGSLPPCKAVPALDYVCALAAVLQEY
jgi:hypothetical protein